MLSKGCFSNIPAVEFTFQEVTGGPPRVSNVVHPSCVLFLPEPLVSRSSEYNEGVRRHFVHAVASLVRDV